MTNVKGKWALLTGASRGIGYLSAVFMAKQGCNLVLHSRTAEHCDKVLAEVKRHDDNTDGQDVLHKEENHTDTYRLAVGTDAAHGSNGRAIVVTDVGINRCE